MVNVDVTATAFFQGIPLLEMVVKILGLRSLGKRHAWKLCISDAKIPTASCRAYFLLISFDF